MVVEAATKTLGADLSLVGRPGLQNKALMSSIFEHFHGEFGCFHTLSLNAPGRGKHSCCFSSSFYNSARNFPATCEKKKRILISQSKKNDCRFCGEKSMFQWPATISCIDASPLMGWHASAGELCTRMPLIRSKRSPYFTCAKELHQVFENQATSSKWHWITSLTFVHDLIR